MKRDAQKFLFILFDLRINNPNLLDLVNANLAELNKENNDAAARVVPRVPKKGGSL